MLALTQLPVHVLGIGALLLFLLLSFLGFFLLPGILLRVRLGHVLGELGGKSALGKLGDKLFSDDRRLSHSWREFKDTLHEQKELDSATRQLKTTGWRSTVPAETFFNGESLVDNRLRTEFFKHLPGVFTGLGIIGTFSGLIQGLQAFEISDQAAVVRQSLNSLLHGVWEAFLVSACAIALAMAVTLFEKLLLASLYRHVNDLAQRLDGLFQSGAGEEYLSRLVKASESSAAQTAMLKDALVNDLKVILTDLTERQIAATAAGHKATGGQISEAIRESMTEPLERIAEAAGEVKKDQGSAVQQLLTDVLAQFSSQLESMLGSQIRGINDLQVQTMERLAAALSQFEQMAKSIRESSGDATRDMTEQVRALVEQLRQSSRTQSEETEVAMKAALAAFAKQTEELIQRIQNQAAAASAQHESRQQQFAEHSQQTLDGLSSQVRGLAGSVSNAVSKLEGTAQAVHAGATSLQASANRFAEAGKEVGNVMDRAATVSKRLIEGVDAISTVTAALASAVAEHRATRDSLAQVVGTAKDVVEIARRDAALTTELVGHLKSAADRLAAAEKQADEYLERVSEVLAEAHDVFTKTLTNAVRESSTEFHKALSNATARLKDAIEALSETLDNVAMK